VCVCVFFEYVQCGAWSQRSIGIIFSFGSTFNVYETSVLDHNNYDIFMVSNLASWIAFIYNLNFIHIHFKKFKPYRGGLTNIKCLDFLLTCSHNHVELMVIKKNLSLTYSIVDFVAIIGILKIIKIEIFLKFSNHTNTLVLFISSYNYNYIYIHVLT
jgi:hypothetical protein